MGQDHIFRGDYIPEILIKDLDELEQYILHKIFSISAWSGHVW